MVVLENGDEVLPLWPLELVRWNAARQEIELVDSGEPSRIADGDAVTLSGSPLSPSEPPVGAPSDDLRGLLRDIPWVSAPSDNCVERAASSWSVGGVIE